MGAPIVTGGTVINEMSATTGLSNGNTGTASSTISVVTGAVRISDTAGGAGSTFYIRIPFSPIDFSTGLLLYGLRSLIRTGMDTPANQGCKIRLYSNAGLTEYAEWVVFGNATLTDGEFGSSLLPHILSPRATSIAFAVTGGYSPTTIQAIDFIHKRSGTGTITTSFGQFSKINSLLITDGVGSAGSFLTLSAFLPGNFNRAPFQQRGDKQYGSIVPVAIGNNSTQTEFSDQFASVNFAGISSTSLNPRLVLTGENDLGLTVNSAASDAVDLELCLLNGNTSSHLRSLGSGTINIANGGLVQFSNVQLDRGNFNTALSLCKAVQLEGADLSGSAIADSAVATGAIVVTSAAEANLDNCTISGNTIGVLFDGVTGSIVLDGTTFSGNTTDIRAINLGSGTLTITVSGGTSAGAIVSSTDSSGTLVIQNAPVLLNASNFADGTRVFVAHQQVFEVAHTAINTTTNTIALGTDSNGDSPDFSLSDPRTLVHFQLSEGATLPTTTPQIRDSGVYYLKSNTAGAIELSITSGGSAIDFSTQGSGTFTLIAETELGNSAVTGGSGYSLAIDLPDRALIHTKAEHWKKESGLASASNFLNLINAWSAVSGLEIVDTVDADNPDTQDLTHQIIVSVSELPLEGVVQTAAGSTIASITLPDSGDDVTGLSLALEGTGRIQINANDVDGVISWQEMYLWGKYIAATEAGIRLVTDTTFSANNLFNYQFENLELDNTSSTTLQIVGGVGRSIDGAPFVSVATTGSIIPNALSRGTGAIVETSGGGGGGATAEEITDYLDANSTKLASILENTEAIADLPTNTATAVDTTLAGDFTAVLNAIDSPLQSDDARLDFLDASINSRSTLTSGQVETAVAASLNTYGSPTRSELTGDKDEILAAIDSPLQSDDIRLDFLDASINSRSTLTSGQAQTAAAAALTAYDPPTRTEATADKDAVIAAIGTPLQNGDYTAPPTVEAIASEVQDTLTDEFAALTTAINETQTLLTSIDTELDALSLLDTIASNVDGVEAGIAGVSSQVSAVSAIVGALRDVRVPLPGEWMEAVAPEEGTPGYIETSTGILLEWVKNPDGSERVNGG